MITFTNTGFFNGWNAYEISYSLRQEFLGRKRRYGDYRVPEDKRKNYLKREFFYDRVASEFQPLELRDLIISNITTEMKDIDLSKIVCQKFILNQWHQKLSFLYDNFEKEIKNLDLKPLSILKKINKGSISSETVIMIDDVLGDLFENFDKEPNAKLLWWPFKTILETYRNYLDYDSNITKQIFGSQYRQIRS